MESLWNKYNKIKEVFYRDFVHDSGYTEQASCIPLSSVKNGAGWVGDGTINLAQYLQFLYTEMIHAQSTVSFEVIEKRSNAIFIKFNPTPAPSEQHGVIYRFQINNKKYVFMFSNNYDGKSDLIQNADEDVDCMTYAQDTSLYSNDSFFVFV